MTTIVHKLYDVDHEAILNFVNQYLQAVYVQEINPTLLFAIKFGFISVDMYTLTRITGMGLHKIPH
jgi:hypothetical protein